MAQSIRVSNVSKLYEGEQGVRHFDLTVEPGTILGMIGPSGSGKTTIVRLLTGLLTPDSGELEVLGKRPGGFDAETRSLIGYLPQESSLYPELSVRENLDFAAALHRMRGRRRAEAVSEVLELVELTGSETQPLRELSTGMKRRIGLAASLVHGPTLIFLDEPTASLDPILRKTIWSYLAELRSQGRTLVVTTQYVGEAVHCDRVAMLAEGRVLAHGAPDDLRRAAYDGEMVNVVFGGRPEWDSIDAIGEAIGAISFNPLGPSTVQYVVEDARSAIPEITRASESLGLEVTETERHVPEFDDVFVRLMDRVSTADSAR